jgi:hypothetical protein
MEDQESLEAGTCISELADTVEDGVDDLLADGVMSTGVVVGSVLLSTDDLFGMVELGVLSGTDLVTDGRFQVDENGARDVLTGRRLGEERVERIIGDTDRFIGWHRSIRQDSVLEAVKLPAVVSDLDTGLTEVD